MELQEGKEYKKRLLDLVRITGITDFSELINIELSDNADSDDSECESEAKCSIEESAEDELQREAICVFQTKVIEMKQYLDEYPTLTSKLNTELEMLTSEPRIIASSSTTGNTLEDFIWKFHIEFEWEDRRISLPIQVASDITSLNSALSDEITYQAVYDHLVFVYGTNKLRNMSTATKRLFKMLIDERCYDQVSWTGKGPSGRNVKLAFKDQNNIHKVLLEVLCVSDKNYTQENLHEDIVYKILKPKTNTNN